MQLVIICGMLGSGKTTLLLRLVKLLQSDYSQIAIIENEVGEIGVDANYLSRKGLNVQELYSGCVCCTLSTDLIVTLEKLQELYSPEIVFMEASGVARPNDLLNTIEQYGTMIEDVKVLSIIDATRYVLFSEMLSELLCAHIECSDVLIINKIDETKREEIGNIKEDTLIKKNNAKTWFISVESDDYIPARKWLT